MLDVESEVDLFVLHCVFLLIINSSLKSFLQAWNLYPLRTECSWSPKKILWLNSILRHVDEPDEIGRGFGIDFNGPLPEDEVGSVIVPDTVRPLSDEQRSEFMSVASSITFHTFDGYYLLCKDTLSNMQFTYNYHY